MYSFLNQWEGCEGLEVNHAVAPSTDSLESAMSTKDFGMRDASSKNPPAEV